MTPPCNMQAAMTGKAFAPTRTRAHGLGTEGLCNSINHAGNTIAVGLSNGKIQVVDPHTSLVMDTIDLASAAHPPAGKTHGERCSSSGLSAVPELSPSVTAVR